MKRKTKNFLFMPSVAFAAAYLIWGFNTAGIKIVVATVPIYTYLAIRYGIGAFVLYPIAKRKWRPIKPKLRRRILLSSFLGNVVPMVAVSIGLQKTSAVAASVIYLLEPVLMYVLSMEMLRERFRPRILMGLIVSLLGSAVLIAAPLLEGHQMSSQFWGNMLVLLAVVSSVIGAIIIKPILDNTNISLNQITVVRFIQSFALLLPFAIWQVPRMFNVHWTTEIILAMLYGIIFATILAFPIYHYGLKKLSGEEGSVFHYLDPVGGILGAVIVLHETISTLIIFGSLLVCWGIYLSEVRYKFVRFPFIHAHK